MSKLTTLLFNQIAQQSNIIAYAADRLLARIVPEASAEATLCLLPWQPSGCCTRAGHLYERLRLRCWNLQTHSWYYKYSCTYLPCRG
jgi:hypothetical protein